MSRQRRHVRLTAKLAFGSDLACHARHFGREGIELIDHGINSIFQLENFATNVDSDFAGEVPASHRGGNLGDVAHLVSEVSAHRVDGISQILPGSGYAGDDCLTPE